VIKTKTVYEIRSPDDLGRYALPGEGFRKLGALTLKEVRKLWREDYPHDLLCKVKYRRDNQRIVDITVLKEKKHGH
jgi:hypothetical protein